MSRLTPFNVFVAAVAAVAVQPLVLALRLAPEYFSSPQPFYGIALMLLGIFVVAAFGIFALGIPAFLLLRKFGRDSWFSLALAGLLLGASLAVFQWPVHIERFSTGRNWHGKYVDTYINGAPTIYAWLAYAEWVLYFALHGLAGALTFYAVWRRLDRAEPASR